MPNNLDFAALIPKRDTFTDSDGRIYEFINRTDFGAVETARLHRLQKEVEQSLASLQADLGNEEAAVQFETAVNGVLALILPAMPRERLAGFTLGQKQAVVEFWNKAQDALGAAPVGEAPAGQPARP